MRLEKVTALVTGASSGIGQAVSSHFRREGARLLLTGRKERLDTAQPDDLYVPGDLNDEAFVEGLAHQAAESLGTVDVVVLNHGLQVSSPLTEMAYDDAKNVLHSNLLSAFLVMKHFAPLMPADRRLVRLRQLTARHGRQARGSLVLRRQGRPDHARQGRGDRMGPAQHPRQRRRSGPDRHPDHRSIVPAQARPRGLPP